MLLQASQISVKLLGDVPANHLLISVGREPTLLWVFESEGKVWATFLSGDHARHAFASTGNPHWSGVVIGPVEVRVDPRSVRSGKEANSDLRGVGQQLAVPVILKNQGFDDRTWLPISTFDGYQEAVYFSRWSIGWEDAHGEWIECVDVDNGTIATSLVKPQK